MLPLLLVAKPCVCRVRGDPIADTCKGDLLFLNGQTEYDLASSSAAGCSFDVSVQTNEDTNIPVSMSIVAEGSTFLLYRDHTLEVDGVEQALPYSFGDVVCEREDNRFLVCTVDSCQAQFGFWGEVGMSEGILVIPPIAVEVGEGSCFMEP